MHRHQLEEGLASHAENEKALFPAAGPPSAEIGRRRMAEIDRRAADRRQAAPVLPRADPNDPDAFVRNFEISLLASLHGRMQAAADLAVVLKARPYVEGENLVERLRSAFPGFVDEALAHRWARSALMGYAGEVEVPIPRGASADEEASIKQKAEAMVGLNPNGHRISLVFVRTIT